MKRMPSALSRLFTVAVAVSTVPHPAVIFFILSGLVILLSHLLYLVWAGRLAAAGVQELARRAARSAAQD
jgi:hypothetical protein